jgi:hypothetical protein
LPFAALAIVVAIPIHVAVAIAEAPMIAPEGSFMAVVVITAVLARLRMRLGMLRRGLEAWLREPTLVEQIIAIILAEIVAALGAVIGPAQALLAVAVVALARLMHLLPVRHDDAAVVLRMLEIVLGKHRIARGLGVARKGDIFFRDMSGRTANLYVRPVRLKAAR